MNDRFVHLSDRARSQWTFYQFLQALCKHILQRPCPVQIDFPALFDRLREAGASLTQHAAPALLEDVERTLSRYETKLLEVDDGLSPSLLRRFFDRLRTQDEKVLLAMAKFYLGLDRLPADAADKLDILLTRLVEIPRIEGEGTIARAPHEIERLIAPLLVYRRAPNPDLHEATTAVLHDLQTLCSDASSATSFTDLMESKVLDRHRTLKHALGETMFDSSVLPAVLETTVLIKNRFRELWADEEQRILDDTNRVLELQRQLARSPEMITEDLREALEGLANLRRRVDSGREAHNLRREDAVELRRALSQVLDRFDRTQGVTGALEPAPRDAARPEPTDPVLQEPLRKILCALELADCSTPPAELARSRELQTFALESWEVQAAVLHARGALEDGTIAAERQKLYVNAAALRLRLQESEEEIVRLSSLGSDRLSHALDQAAEALQRASEFGRRFEWFIEDALYRGETEQLALLYRSRFRLVRVHSSLWLAQDDHGGAAPF